MDHKYNTYFENCHLVGIDHVESCRLVWSPVTSLRGQRSVSIRNCYSTMDLVREDTRTEVSPAGIKNCYVIGKEHIEEFISTWLRENEYIFEK